jgi:hypothetical protein
MDALSRQRVSTAADRMRGVRSNSDGGRMNGRRPPAQRRRSQQRLAENTNATRVLGDATTAMTL